MFVQIERVVVAFCFLFFTIELGDCMSVQQREISSRIIGGNPAQIGAFPFQVSLRTTSNAHFCGGALISERWVLSAASCVYGKLANQILIVVGADSIWDGTIYSCENITKHERFDVNTREYDIAVLKTSRDVSNTTYVQPTGYYRSTVGCNIALVTSGWGNTENGVAQYLHYLNVTSITSIGCKTSLLGNTLTEAIVLSTQNVCVYGTFNTGSSICDGDGGSPLFRPLSRVVVGILSFATCADRIPGVFTMTGSHQAWILTQTNVTASTTY